MLVPTTPERNQYKLLELYYQVGTEGCPSDATIYITDYAEGELEGGGTQYAVINLDLVPPNACVTFKAVLELKDNTEIIEIASEVRPESPPEITSYSIEYASGSNYLIKATFANLKPTTQAFIRSQQGNPDCVAPEPLPANTGSGAAIAEGLLADGEYLQAFNRVSNFSLMLLLADGEDNVLDYKVICRDYDH